MMQTVCTAFQHLNKMGDPEELYLMVEKLKYMLRDHQTPLINEH